MGNNALLIVVHEGVVIGSVSGKHVNSFKEHFDRWLSAAVAFGALFKLGSVQTLVTSSSLTWGSMKIDVSLCGVQNLLHRILKHERLMFAMHNAYFAYFANAYFACNAKGF